MALLFISRLVNWIIGFDFNLISLPKLCLVSSWFSGYERAFLYS